jgi:hypothetical protein
MTSREVVQRAVHFKRPDRLPVIFDAFGVNDLHGVGWKQIGTGDRAKRETLDEWGCLWVRSEVENMGQVKGHPLADDAAWSSYRWPDASGPAFYEGMSEKFKGSEGKYVCTGIFMLIFERMHSLCGFEKVLTDFYLNRPLMERLADRIVEFDCEIVRQVSSRFPGRIDGFTFTDDWGTELALFVHPKFWREFFMPRYRRIFDACHAAGWDVWMHSCGKVNDIIAPLIDIGCNVINLQQPRALGIEEVGLHFAGKICFQSLCDIQHTLPMKSDAEIRAEAKLLLDCWATDDGGFVLADYGDGRAIGVPDSKKRVMFDAFMEYDRWRRKP